MRYFSVLFLATLCSFALTACDITGGYLKQDRANNIELQDYRDALAPREVELPAEGKSLPGEGIPDIESYVSQDYNTLKPMPLVTVKINQTIPLREALYEMAQQADYDIELDPRISGSVIFSAREKPLDMVVQRIADVAGLRYKFDNDTLRIELDTPYNKSYKMDYLSFVRSNSSSITTDISVVSGDGASTGSTFTADSSSESDFWTEVEDSLAQILSIDDTASLLRTNDTPQINVARPAPQDNIDTAVGEDDFGTAGEQPEPTLRIESLPTGGNGSGTAPAPQAASYSISRQAGVVNVFATEKQHKQVVGFLTELKRSATAQVLIEAKILEVTLNDNSSLGIQWNALDLPGPNSVSFTKASVAAGTNPLGLLLDADLSRVPANSTGEADGSNFRFFTSGSDVTALIDALSVFGTVNALASPRITVLNNQSAVLNVAENRVYFEIDVEEEEDEDTNETTLTIESTAQTVPEGVLINVLPSIDLDNQTVMMQVRPTITRIVNTVTDPGTALISAPVENEIPEVGVQEFDSIVRLRSGQAMVMGGLMEDRVDTDTSSVPVLGELPVLGAAFRSNRDLISKTELVVFIKATIIDNFDNIHPTDKDLYRKFGNDRRPLRL